MLCSARSTPKLVGLVFLAALPIGGCANPGRDVVAQVHDQRITTRIEVDQAMGSGGNETAQPNGVSVTYPYTYVGGDPGGSNLSPLPLIAYGLVTPPCGPPMAALVLACSPIIIVGDLLVRIAEPHEGELLVMYDQTGRVLSAEVRAERPVFNDPGRPPFNPTSRTSEP